MSVMNIIAGKYKRRKLKYPKDRLFRPTKSIVREAVFNKIGSDIEGASFLDLCAGSGAMGFEAESRGAGHVVCVDRNTRYLKDNIDLLSASLQCVRSDALYYLKTLTKDAFDYIYFDPVWADHRVYISALSLIFEKQLVIQSGRLFVEHDRSLIIPDQYEQHIVETNQYGESLVSIW